MGNAKIAISRVWLADATGRGANSSQYFPPPDASVADRDYFQTLAEKDVGTYISSGIGDFWAIEREHEKLLKDGPGRVSPFFIPSAIVNLASGQVSIRHNAKGPNSATATACSAGAHAIGEKSVLARWRLGDGRALTIAINLGEAEVACLAPSEPLLFESCDGAHESLREGTLVANAAVAMLT